MKNKSGLQKNMKVYVVVTFLILLLLVTTIYFYNHYQKEEENNRKLKAGLKQTVLLHLATEKHHIEALMTIVESQEPSANKIVPAAAYSDLTAAKEAVGILKHNSGIELKEMEVLMSMNYTLSSLNSFLSQIDGYYGYKNQQPFELKNCANGSLKDEKDIYNELGKFLEIIAYTEEDKLDWDHLVSNWEVDNPYSCNY